MDNLTLNKMRELLEGAKEKISCIEMRATPDNVNAVANSINFIQIVINTISVELSDRSKEDKEEHINGTESDAE